MSAKFDEDAHNGLVYWVHSSFPYVSTVTLTFKINRVHPLTMVNTSAKFDEEIHNGLVYRVHKLIIRPSSDGTYYGMVMSVHPPIFCIFLIHALT